MSLHEKIKSSDLNSSHLITAPKG